MRYTYFLRDYFENDGDYPLSGEHYITLMQHCFKYSSFLSFIVYDDNISLIKELETWIVQTPDIKLSTVNRECLRKVYHACEEVYNIISAQTNDLFSFCHLSEENFPEDPVFFRKDGTVFFDSVIHEGECSIYPRSNENVEKLLNYGHWLPTNEAGIPNVPAIDHQLVPSLRENVVKDPLYLLLLEVRKQPEQYLEARTIEELEYLINSYRPEKCRDISLNITLPIVFTPRWYRAFEFFLLSKCNAMTTTKISVAMHEAGYSGSEGYTKFFEFFDWYLQII